MDTIVKKRVSRRDFLKLGAAAGAALAVSNISKTATAMPVKNKTRHRYAMVIDLARCIGCEACSVACKVEHNVPPSPDEAARRIQWTEVSFKEEGTYPYVKKRLDPRPCYHCENPPCVKVCPVGATYRDEERGLVLQRYERCIGWRESALFWPFKYPFFYF